MLERFKLWVDGVLHGISEVLRSRRSGKTRSTQWDSMLLAASEELLDDHDLGVVSSLPAGVTLDEVVGYILAEARGRPSYKAMEKHLTRHYPLDKQDAIRAIDRTLGGAVRAAFRRANLCPDPVQDPVGCCSFKKATEDYSLVHDIYHGYILPDTEGKSVKIKPRLYADFNGIERLENEDYLLLDGRGTVDDLKRLGLHFQEGLEALFYDDAEDEEGNADDIQAEGVMKYDPQYKWVAVIEWDKIHHASDRRVDK